MSDQPQQEQPATEPGNGAGPLSTNPLSDQVQAQRLRHMKLIPLALLLFMAVVFALTLHGVGWLGYVHAFAEAAMVGALADWFAVTALFRHPMGIPIPHTAIIAKRKDAIGASMARFVEDNFLNEDAVHRKLSQVNLAARLAQWLQSPAARSRVTDAGLRAVAWLMSAIDEVRLRGFVGRLSERNLDLLPLAPLAGKLLELLTVNNRHQDLLTQLLRFLIVLLSDNRELIRDKVQHESPWWMPGFIDDRIVRQLIQRIETLLLEMSLDNDHPLRQEFNQSMERLANDLQTSKEFRVLGERIKHDLLANDALHDFVVAVWADLESMLQQQIEDPESGLRQTADRLLTALAAEMSQDKDLQQVVNRWIDQLLSAVVVNNRGEMASLISDTVASWDAQTTARRVELAIGRDLQFIRINGTLVGGLVGLVIHAVTNWLGAG